MRHEHSKRLYAYWNRLRGERSAPERTEIEPSDIRQLLADTFILEVDQRHKAISFRLAGTRLCAAYGRELKGYGFLGLWQEECTLEVLRAITRVHRDHQPCMISYLARTGQNRFTEWECVLLPLLPAEAGEERILGIATTQPVPLWLGTEPLVDQRLQSVRTIAGPPENGAWPWLAKFGGQRDGNRRTESKPVRTVAHLTVHEGGKA